MTAEQDDAERVAPAGPMATELGELRRRLDRAHAGAEPLDGPLLVAELETAYEELRTADDELRTQLDQLVEAERGAECLRGQYRRLLSALPVPTLTTDANGLVRSANPAAASLAGTPVDRLVGKPVLVLFALEDRAELRARIADQGRVGGVFRLRATVVDRRGTTTPVDLTAAVPEEGDGEVTWVVLPEARHRGEPGADRHLLPEVLVRLAALPSATGSVDELLTRAAVLCRAALGHDVELSVVLGPPEHPDAAATTDTVAAHLDSLQVRRDHGPSIEAHRGVATVHTEDLRTDRRWPDLADDVPGTVGAVVAAPVVDGGAPVGVLSVYRTRTGTDPVLVETVEVLAATMAALLHELDLTAELLAAATDIERALWSRSDIDEACGIVMLERDCTATEAFQHLVRLADDQGLGVRELARSIVARRSGPLDPLL